MLGLNKKTFAGLILVIATITAAVYGATLYTQKYTYTPGTGLTARSQIDFGALAPGARGQKTEVGAVNTGNINSAITMSFNTPETTWDRVFGGILIEVRTQNATNPLTMACIARGSMTCDPGVDATFRPPGTPTQYDYLMTYITVSTLPSTAPTLQTNWAQ